MNCLFSHLEEVSTRQLWLTDPFLLPADHTSPVVCQYDSRKADADLALNAETLAQFAQAYLPQSLDPAHVKAALSWQQADWQAPFDAQHLYRFVGCPDDPARLLPMLSKEPNHTQAGWIATEVTRTKLFIETAVHAGLKATIYLPRQVVDQILPHLPPCKTFVVEGSYQKCVEMMAHDGIPNYGPWGNPYRLEGFKLVAMGLAAFCNQNQKQPTVLLIDEEGEACAAFGRVARWSVAPKPYRVILIQRRLYSAIAGHFEGSGVTTQQMTPWFSSPVAFGTPALPLRGLQLCTQTLQSTHGTALSLDPDQVEAYSQRPYTSLFNHAIELLARTGFVDEDDTLFCLAAHLLEP